MTMVYVLDMDTAVTVLLSHHSGMCPRQCGYGITHYHHPCCMSVTMHHVMLTAACTIFFQLRLRPLYQCHTPLLQEAGCCDEHAPDRSQRFFRSPD